MKELTIGAGRDPLHEGINSYGFACTLERDDAVDPEGLRCFAAELMTSICTTCVARGAEDIGHVKAYLEHATGFLHANSLGLPNDVTVEGRDGAPADRLDVTVNAVIVGLSGEEVKTLSVQAMERVAQDCGWSRILQRRSPGGGERNDDDGRIE